MPRTEMQRRFSRSSWLAWLVVIALGTTACSDSTVPTATSGKTPPTPAFAVVYDPAINQADSYVAEDMSSTESSTLYFDHAVYDPVVDGFVTSMQLPTTSESDHVEGGYGYDDATRINFSNWGDDDYNGGIVSTSVVNDAITFRDASGAVVPTMDASVYTDLLGVSSVNTIGGGGGGAYCPDNDPSCRPPDQMNVGVSGGMNIVVDAAALGGAVPARPSSTSRPDGSVEETTLINEPNRHGQIKKVYTKRDGQWVLLTEDEETTQSFGSITLKSNVHRDHKKYVFHTNPEKDKVRAEWRKTHPSKPPASSGIKLSSPTIAGARPTLATHNDLTVPTAPRADFTLNNGPGQGLALVHGARSSESTWFPYMEPWLVNAPSRYVFTKVLAPSLAWRNNMASQAADLQSRASFLGPDALFIGHSMGGLVSRKVGQYNAASTGSLVKGVVSIDTPHQGAIIAHALFWSDYTNLITNMQSAAFVKYCGQSAAACLFDSAIASMTLGEFQAMFSVDNGSTTDIVPGSYALYDLNHATERFIRGGVQNQIQGRFKWARLWGDSHYPPDAPGGGREWQRRVSQFFLAMRYCKNSFFVAFFAPIASGSCARVYSTILHLDEAFERHVDPANQGSDGMVVLPSQVYPNTPTTVGPPRNYQVVDGDSHLGVLKSARTLDAVANRVLPFYGLPQR